LSAYFISTSSENHPAYAASLTITGNRNNINFNAVDVASKLGNINLTGTYYTIDASNITLGQTANISYDTALNYHRFSVNSFDSITLSGGNDVLIVNGDISFTVNAGAGDDTIKANISGNITASIDGGAGNDILDLSGSGFVDLTQSTLSNIESIKYGTSTLVVTDSQLASWSFDGSGAKFTKSATGIIGTAGNDNYSGNGTGSFQGGKGDDSINSVDTAVFTGNFDDYDFSRSGNTLTVQQSRGSLSDGTDNLVGVMNLKFADTTYTVDDAPDNPGLFINNSSYLALTKADYGKQISAQKNYGSDYDVFAATLAPSSPLSIQGSFYNWMYFMDAANGQQIQFKSLIYGSQYDRYYNWMSGDAKWLPVVNINGEWKAYQGGDVVLQVEASGTIQDYAFTLNFLDDYAGSVDTLGQMDAQLGVVKGYIGELGDTDWIRTNLIAGTKYEFNLLGEASGGGTLVDPKLQLLDSQGRVLENGVDLVNNSVGNDDTLVFRPTVTGTYYLSVSDVAKINTGSWTLTQKSLDTIAGNTSTTERIEWSGAQTFTVSSEINILSDHDWFKVWLDKGLTNNFQSKGTSAGGTLADPQLSLRSVTGILLAQDDNSGGTTDATLVYSAADSGWYYLDAGASGNASKGTYTLSGSTLEDDFANTDLTTGIIQPGTPVHGLITYNGDSDWFKVGLSKGNTYVIDLSGDVSSGAQLDPLTDPLLIIRDASGAILFKADDFGGSLDSRAYFTPTADGLYFLEAKSAFKYNIGAYQLSVALAPADDFINITANTSASLALGVAKAGVIGTPGDKDMFQINLEAGKVYQVSLDGVSGHAGTLVDPYLRVYDSQGHLIDFDNNGGVGNDAQFYLSPTATGTYYVEASAFNDRDMGSYQVSVVQRNIPADDVPNDLSTNVFLTPGDSFEGNLLTHNDQDWFGINLEANKDYVFRTKASDSGNGSLVDPVMEIRAADGTLIKTIDNMLISNDPATAFTPNANGTYYLVVKAANGQTDTGTYTLVTRAPDDYSNTKPGAAVIALNQTLDGAIQWSDGAYGVRAYDSIGLATDSDEDWFQFTATQDQVLSINVKMALNSTLSRPMVEIVDSQGRSVAVGDGLETKDGLAVATFKASGTGSYYARVIDGSGATGAYQISLTAGDASDEDTQGPVSLDFVSTGAVIQAQVSARIGLSGDIDNFTVALQAGHSYRFETLAVRDGTHEPLASASLSLGYQAQGANTFSPVDVARDVATPSFFDSTVFVASTSGVMKIGVQPLDATQTGQYKIRVIDLGTNQADDRPDLVSQYVDATNGVLAANENQAGKIDSADDVDLFAINLTTGNIYDFAIKGFADGLGTLAQGDLRLLDSAGNLVTAGAFDSLTGRTDMAVSVFADGRYYLAVSAANLPGNTGTFTLDTRLRDLGTPSTDDMSADTRSGVTVAPGIPVNATINYAGDQDWVRASLVAGKVYVIDVLGNGNGAGGTLTDSTLRLLDANGNEVAFDDNSGAGQDSHLQFTPEASGDYYLDVGGNGSAIGTYTLRLRELYSGVADPLKSAQWYLSALGLDKLGGQLTGAGITIGIVDDGIDTSHPDLQNQLNFALAYDTQFNTNDGQPKYPVLLGTPDNHGTAVAGIIAAQANNETGIVGIASDATLVSTRVHWTWDQITEALGKQYQFDISNNSWGAINPFGDNFNSTALTFAYQALRTGVEDGRGGKGTVFVFSSGNSAAYGDNTNYHNFQNAREVITVAAANSDGSVAGFSTPGANVLVGAYGVGLLTTDRHQPGLGYDLSSGYTNFSGTSAAAPVVSGIVALMLEANANLGYRDIQKILALSAWHPDNQDWKSNGATNLNLGGLKFNDHIGFGLVDAYSAVQIASTWTELNTAINEVSDSARSFNLGVTIPDGTGAVYSKTFQIDNAMKVGYVELGVDLRSTRLGDLIIQLISPNGTISTLMDRPTVNAEQPFGLSGVDSGVPNHLVWDFSSVQFMGNGVRNLIIGMLSKPAVA
jgi:subtilisin family serine protease